MEQNSILHTTLSLDSDIPLYAQLVGIIKRNISTGVLAVGDLAFQQKCLNKMSDVASSGRAVLYVSHNMRTVSQLCNRALFLDHGKLLYDGDTDRAIELYGGAGNRDTERDLNSMTRPRDRGERMRMLKMTTLNSHNVEFQQDGQWEFKITCISNVDERNLRLRLILKNNVAVPIAMTEQPPKSP